MKLLFLVEGVMMKLGQIPGLSFLHRYVNDIHGRHTRFYQTIGDYQGYVRAAREAGGDVANAARGPKKEDDADEEDDLEDTYDEDDDDESYML